MIKKTLIPDKHLIIINLATEVIKIFINEQDMIFLETEKLNLCAPSKDNVQQWTNWVNSSFARNTIFNLKTPKTVDMQWNWIQSELNSNKRILLEMCDKQNNEFLGVISLSCIDYEKISTDCNSLQ